MLPTFPKIEEWRHRTNGQLIEKLAAQLSPMLGEIDRHIQFEGRQTTILRHDDSVGHSPLHAITGEIRIPTLPLVDLTNKELLMHLRKLAEQLAKGVSESFFAEMDRATTAIGNVVDAKGQPLSERLILKMLERMEHSFEPDGTWNPPTLVGSPAAIDKLMRSRDSDTSGSEEFNQSLKRILERKRDDFHRREIDRVLAG